MMKATLGVGLIGIGKPWGHVPGEVPGEKEALEFLEFAFELGIRHFDTAPSYGGISEERLGKFLGTLGRDLRREVTVATKFGEHWDFGRGEPFVDHSFAALRGSLERSLEVLGEIDILQLHKTTPAVLRSADLGLAWEFAAGCGVRAIGASVSDPESAGIVAGESRYSWIQLPFNLANPGTGDWIDSAVACGKLVAVNRPFAMGAMMHGLAPVDRTAAFSFILRRGFSGVVLTGTRSRGHLAENWGAFREALVR